MKNLKHKVTAAVIGVLLALAGVFAVAAPANAANVYAKNVDNENITIQTPTRAYGVLTPGLAGNVRYVHIPKGRCLSYWGTGTATYVRCASSTTGIWLSLPASYYGWLIKLS